jgi:hypothetical protein
MTRSLLAATALALGLVLAGAAPQASADDSPQDIQLSYTVQLTTPGPAITSIVTFNSYANGYGAWWASSIPAETVQATIVDPFLKSSDNPPADALLVGLVQDLPGDAPGQKHIVIMMSSDAAAASSHIAWGTLFRNTDEDQLIASLELMTSGQDGNTIQPGIDAMFAFANGDARNGILGAGGVPIDAWFTLGAVLPGSTNTTGFKVVAFSSGEVIGEGLAAVASVPEAGSGALLLAGMAVMVFVARRRG